MQPAGVSKSLTRSALRGKDTIGIRLGRVFARSKMGKHFRYTITDDSFQPRARQR